VLDGTVGVGVIGAGYWGPNIIRALAETPGARVMAVADLDPKRLATSSKRFPYVRTTNRAKGLE